MAQKTLAEVWDDPKFKGASPEVQRAVLGKLGVSKDRQDKLFAKLAGTATPKTALVPSHVPTAPPDFLSRASRRASESIRAGAYLIPTALEATSEVLKHPKPLPKPTLAGGVKSYLTAGPKAAYETVSGLAKEYRGDPALLAGDVAAGYVLGKGVGAGEGERAPVARTGTRAAETVPERTPVPPAIEQANLEHAERMAVYAEKEAQSRADWMQRYKAATKSEADKIYRGHKLQLLDENAADTTRRFQYNLHATHEAVRGALDERWNQLRTVMRGTESAEPEAIYNAIRYAEKEYLRGSPQSVQQFRNIIKELGIKEYTDTPGGLEETTEAVAAAKPLEWETARVHYSAIGDRLASGNLPGNVYQALKHVSGAIDKDLAQMAATKNQTGIYAALKRDWSEYMSDWKDTRALSKGGSPIAVAMQARDPGYVRVTVNGAAGERMLRTLDKYKRFGAQSELGASVRDIQKEIRTLSKTTVKTAAMPPEYKPSSPPAWRPVDVAKAEAAAASPPVPYWVKATGRITGKLGGGLAGSVIGHPFLGWAAGGEAGQAIAERLWRGKQ